MLRNLLAILITFYSVTLMSQAQEVVGGKKKVELSFETKVRKVLTTSETKIVTVEYAFENKTNKVIEIVEFDAPCTCMSARLRRADGSTNFAFKPGEKGVVIGKLDFENFTGSIDKKIWIRTSEDEKGSPSIVLTASVTIPTLISPDKSAIKWDLNGEKTAQTIMINVENDEPIHILNHSLGYGADEVFEYTLETVEKGKTYKVVVTPKSTETPTIGVLRFFTDHEQQRYKTVQIFLNVSKKK